MKRRLGPVSSSLYHLIQQHQKPECPGIPPLSHWSCRLMTIKQLRFSVPGCLNSIHFTIQRQQSQFKLLRNSSSWDAQTNSKTPGIFNNTCKLNHNRCRKSLTLSGNVRFAEWAHTNACAIGSTLLEPDSLYLH